MFSVVLFNYILWFVCKIELHIHLMYCLQKKDGINLIVNSFAINSAIGLYSLLMSKLYLGLAEASAGRGVDGDGAATLIALHDDGDVGKTTASLAFRSRPYQHRQQQHHGDSVHHHLEVSTQRNIC